MYFPGFRYSFLILLHSGQNIYCMISILLIYWGLKYGLVYGLSWTLHVHLKRMCVLLLLSGVFYRGLSGTAGLEYCLSLLSFIFCLSVLCIIESGKLKSHIIAESSIPHFGFVSVCSMYSVVLVLDEVTKVFNLRWCISSPLTLFLHHSCPITSSVMLFVVTGLHSSWGNLLLLKELWNMDQIYTFLNSQYVASLSTQRYWDKKVIHCQQSFSIRIFIVNKQKKQWQF